MAEEPLQPHQPTGAATPSPRPRPAAHPHPSPRPRPRARALGVIVGILPTGAHNAITDVAGVRIGHATLIANERVRTGVTAILPHGGNIYRERVPAGVFVGNGFGKLIGFTQVEELGEIETPILLTNTLAAPRVADALIDWTLQQTGNEAARSINPLVGETNDGVLNDIQGRHIGRLDVFEAIRAASDGPVAEGAVGAGTGTICFGWKGGIGTASRVIPRGAGAAGGFTVGVLVQSNYGGVLTINGAPVGRELGRYYLREHVEPHPTSAPPPPPTTRDADQAADRADGSIMMIVATDAPLDARNLKRLAARTMLGLGRTGASASNGSGDYAIAFTTRNRIRPEESMRTTQALANDAMSPLFQAVIEATEEAIYNSLFQATTVTGREGRTVEALPIEATLNILKRFGVAS